MEESLQQQKESFGFQDSDVDDLRRLISDTNVYLLAVTLLASTLHLLFEVRAAAAVGATVCRLYRECFQKTSTVYFFR